LNPSSSSSESRKFCAFFVGMGRALADFVGASFLKVTLC
jgi:hypothetical protein